jgi:hypothetical protein
MGKRNKLKEKTSTEVVLRRVQVNLVTPLFSRNRLVCLGGKPYQEWTVVAIGAYQDPRAFEDLKLYFLFSKIQVSQI